MSALSQALSSFGVGLGTGNNDPWYTRLRPASFRGVPFAVLSDEVAVGRRVAIHQYPYRDTPYVEDLGRGLRRINLVAFVAIGDRGPYGGDIFALRDILAESCEREGPGILVHPTLGRLKVSCTALVITSKWDKGGYFEFALSFLESGERAFPDIAVATGAAVLAAAGNVDAAAKADFVTRALRSLRYGAAVAQRAVTTVERYVRQVQGFVNKATNLFHLGSTLQGTFGRYFGGRTRGGFRSPTRPSAGSARTFSGLVAQGTASRAAVSTASSKLTTGTAAIGLGASSVSPNQVADDSQAVAASLLAACADPGDATTVLSELSSFDVDTVNTSSAIGTAQAGMQSATVNMLRLAAVAALARAATTYEPSSYDDAVRVRDQVCAAIDVELARAGDNGDDATYAALRALRAAVVKDFNVRGANLAPIVDFKFNALQPAVVLANRLYRDPTRADELITQVNPVHPLFMPVAFRALAR